MKFGENLKRLRKSKKLSQEALAEKMQVSRQSVSKWETGDAYPEMNNILELCKIFHCSINELVNDNIIDSNLLDEEIKMNVVKFKKEQQRKMKGLSKAIAVMANICRVITLICIPVVIVFMILGGIFINKIHIAANEEQIFTIDETNDSIKVVEADNEVSIFLNDQKLMDTKINKTEILKIKDVLENNSKPMILIYVETGLLFLVINLVLLNIMFMHISKLFANINKENTPFILENVNHIKRIAILMIFVIFLPDIMGILFETIMHMDLNVDIELFNLIEILVLFSFVYIFKYGYEIQLDSNGKIYGDENE